MIADSFAGPSFRVLGSLQVFTPDGHGVDVAPGRQKVVLAALIMNANQVVSSEQLIDLVWGEDPPATARTQIQICVSALRKTLQRAGYAEILLTHRPGYVL